MFSKIKIFLNNIEKYYFKYKKIEFNNKKLTEKEKLFLFSIC